MDWKKRIGKGRPIGELPIPEPVRKQGEKAVRRYQDSFRLAYQAESPVNWCAALGTVLADEEVINGRSERGNHPVQRMPLRQWMLRITAYADRLVEDLDSLDWPGAIKEMQRNWVGRSDGAEVDFFASGSSMDFAAWKERHARHGFPSDPGPDAIRIYTTRPDTLFGATYMLLAPEHPLVEKLTKQDRLSEVLSYRQRVATMSEEDRIAGRGDKNGVFTGAYAVNPATMEEIPVWIADYVLISYGAGAIMAVPGHDQRDLEFAQKFNLPVRAVVSPPADWLHQTRLTSEDYRTRIADLPAAFVDEGYAIQSSNPEVSLNWLPTPEAKKIMTAWLAKAGFGRAAVKYKLRDWLFSRQRYWGEPIPILHELDSDGNPAGLTRTVPEEQLPLLLPELDDFKPTGRPG